MKPTREQAVVRRLVHEPRARKAAKILGLSKTEAQWFIHEIVRLMAKSPKA